MAKKKQKKKSVKIDPLQHEKQFLTNVINKMEECATFQGNNELGLYFKSKADLNRERLKNLK